MGIVNVCGMHTEEFFSEHDVLLKGGKDIHYIGTSSIEQLLFSDDCTENLGMKLIRETVLLLCKLLFATLKGGLSGSKKQVLLHFLACGVQFRTVQRGSFAW
jgi:hypothetical protein